MHQNKIVKLFLLFITSGVLFFFSTKNTYAQSVSNFGIGETGVFETSGNHPAITFVFDLSGAGEDDRIMACTDGCNDAGGSMKFIFFPGKPSGEQLSYQAFVESFTIENKGSGNYRITITTTRAESYSNNFNIDGSHRLHIQRQFGGDWRVLPGSPFYYTVKRYSQNTCQVGTTSNPDSIDPSLRYTSHSAIFITGSINENCNVLKRSSGSNLVVYVEGPMPKQVNVPINCGTGTTEIRENAYLGEFQVGDYFVKIKDQDDKVVCSLSFKIREGGDGGEVPPETIPGQDGSPPIVTDPSCPIDGGTGVNTALGCIPTDDLNRFVAWILKYIIPLASGIAFLLMAYGAIQYLTSGGDPKKIQAGQELITSALTGLLFIILSLFLLRLIGVSILNIPGLGT